MSFVAWLKTEPALITAVLGGGTAVGASLGLNLNATEIKAIYGVLSLVVTVIIRSRVVPLAKAKAAAVVVPSTVAVPVVLPPAPVSVPVLGPELVGHAGLPPADA